MANVALTTNEIAFSKPKRIEGHTSNVEHPILYRQSGTVTSGNLAAGDTFAISHRLTNIDHINITPLNANGATSLYGAASGAATLGAYVNKLGYFINFEALGAAGVLGATTLTLGATADAVNSSILNCWLDIAHTDGTIQTVRITNYVGATKIATISEPLAAAVTTANLYRVRGTVYTSPTAATAPSFSIEVIGSFS
jgi:hypothetical protein